MFNPSVEELLIIVGIIVGVILIVFLILRELYCWYWKINKRIRNQEEIIRLLRKIAGEQSIPNGSD